MKLIIFFWFFNSIINEKNIYFLRDKNHIISNDFKRNYTSCKFKTVKNKKNVILGIIHNYNLNRILPYFKSLIHANISNSDIIMFVRKVSPTVINYLKRNNVLVYHIPDYYKGIKPNHIRWKMYSQFLEEKKNQYNLVFSADVRDSIYQKDFFSYYENYSNFLGIMLEDGTLEHKFSKKHIIEFMGKHKHEIIKNERIICMGTLLGTLEKFLDFSKILWNTLKLNRFPKSDQSVANCLFYLDNVFKDFLVKSDNYGPIMNIAISKFENIKLDFEDNVLNYKGEIAAVVHQYDRKKFLTEKIIMKYHYQFSDIFKSGLDIDIIIIFCIVIVLRLIKLTKYNKKYDTIKKLKYFFW